MKSLSGLTAIAPVRGLGVSHRIVPVAQSRAAHNPFSVVLGLPGLGLKTGAGDDLYKAETQLIVCTNGCIDSRHVCWWLPTCTTEVMAMR